MALSYSPIPAPNFEDNNGDIVVSGYLYTYEAGTTTPLATYSDVNGNTANTNPLRTNSAGRLSSSGVEVAMFLLPTSYKFIFKDSAGVTIWTRDNVSAVPLTANDLDVEGVAAASLAANDLCYLTTAGTWIKADADDISSSLNPEVGFAIAAVANSATGVFRMRGQLDGFAGLVTGTPYYVSATAGAITATPTNTRRYVGTAVTGAKLLIDPIIPETAQTHAISTICTGRLTLTTGVPVTSGDVTAATTIYFTPYQGNTIMLWSPTFSNWFAYKFTQVSVSVPAAANQMYDVFVTDNFTNGSIGLGCVAWTNDTTRASALTTQNGILVNADFLFSRYVGSFRTTGVSGQTEDSKARRLLWNYYNPVPRPFFKQDSTATWDYSTAAWRQVRATAGNQVDCVVGVVERPIYASYAGTVRSDQTTVGTHVVGVGLNSVTVPATGSEGGTLFTAATAAFPTTGIAHATVYPVLGYNYVAMLKYASGAATDTWLGGGSFTSSAVLSGWIEG